MTTVTFTDTLNACNAVKYVSSSHNVRRVFSSTHNSISIPRQVFCPENNNIATSHLALANLISPCETIYSTSSPLTPILNFLEVLSLSLKSHALEPIIIFLHQRNFICFL